VRWTNAVLVLFAVTIFYVALRRTMAPTAATVFFVVLISLTDIWRIWVNTPHFVSMFVILLGAAVFAYLYSKTANIYACAACACILGSMFNFFDFLINPPMMPMLLSFFVLAAGGTTDVQQFAHLQRRLPLAAIVAASWFVGYAVTWFTKWMIVAYLSPDPFQTILGIVGQIQYRTYGQAPDEHTTYQPLLPTLMMIIQSFISGGSVTVAVLAAAIFLHLRDNMASFDVRSFILLASPVAIPFAWFELLSNHTQRHSHFTYRSESAAIALVFAAAILATTPRPDLATLLANMGRRLRQRTPGSKPSKSN
jgi:hypothetical protein